MKSIPRNYPARLKAVHVIGYNFDCLAGHVQIIGRGEASNLRAAVRRAVDAILRDPKLRHKQIGEFKLSVVTIAGSPIQKGEK